MVIWERQVKECIRNKQRMIGTLAQPTLFLVTFGFGLSSTFQAVGNGNYIQYLTPGIVGDHNKNLQIFGNKFPILASNI